MLSNGTRCLRPRLAAIKPRRGCASSRIFAFMVALAFVWVLPVPSANAQHGGPGGEGFHGGGSHGGDFRGGDFAHFGPDELRFWRGGLWRHEWHDGRLGWWWLVGGGWYFYPEPIWPYPTYVPPAIVVPQPPTPLSGLPPAQYWYFCDNPQGYYPYVASCNSPW